MAVIFVMIILAGALVFSIRTPLAVIILMIAEGLVLYLSIWLFSSHNIIYDPIYLLLSLTLCLFILPAAKVSHEKGFYMKQLELADEEIKRLEEQLQKLPPSVSRSNK
jgi:hypothetical protein